MFKKILIANRGEIAVRVIRACREMGIKAVAVHSTADKDSLHAKLADESICIGPGPSTQSYLSIPRLMAAAEISGVDAIHPGYGFLAESAEFAEVCAAYNIKFIGPLPEQIKALGNKVEARALAIKVGVPLLPGSPGNVQSVDEAKKICKDIGFPVIIKAASGGGGRGMKIVTQEKDLERLYHLARSEAEAGFNDPNVFIERYVSRPRHVEVQLAGDRYGNYVHFGERDCSIQRRHQKLIEEAPCPVMTPQFRAELGATAIKLLKAVNYESMATAEFLMDEDGRVYFMEVNTRIQVEHPVSEIVTSHDLIKEQINIASGAKLSKTQDQIEIRGHAIECRINAEDPVTFAPWPGKITAYHEPGGPGVRVDGMIYAGYTVPKYYDSMIAKLITFGNTRDEAIARMKRALNEMKVDGIRTNISFHLRVMDHPNFKSGQLSTKFLEELGPATP
ncbi:MAG: acetyl-CoA carboxylase biotin carboxylase subunit [Oligoflexales bacterium]|nr:acetyl-CoA carboxylase biotin carboxylase subunit [Oligoflexales bacterium]